MKKHAYLLGMPLALILMASCSTYPLYDSPAYNGDEFQDNYLRDYDEIGDREGSLIGEAVTFQRATEVYEDGEAYFFNGNKENAFSAFDSVGMKDIYPELFEYVDEDGNTVSYSSLDTIASRLDDDSYISFGKDHCLAKVDDAFKKGVMGKLYNGQLSCHSWYAVARVQCEEAGFKTLFPLTMTDGDIFAISLRGNTSSTTPSFPYACANIELRFYVDNDGVYDYYQLTYEEAMLWINSGGEAISLIGSSLKDAFGEDFASDGIVGYSISFSEPEDGYFEGSEDFNFEYAEDGEFFGFSLYEVMLIDSTWK